MANNSEPPFTAVYEVWARAWASNNFSTKEILILIALAQYSDYDDSGFKHGWRPRSELAKFANCSESGVTSAISRLKKTDPAKGRNIRGLELMSTGHKGRASEYYIMPDTPLPKNGKKKPKGKKQGTRKQDSGKGGSDQEQTAVEDLIEQIQNGQA